MNQLMNESVNHRDVCKAAPGFAGSVLKIAVPIIFILAGSSVLYITKLKSVLLDRAIIPLLL